MRGRVPRGFDQAGFDALIDAHHPALHNFARRRLADRESVEEVLAETFAIAWRRRDDIPDQALPWLFGVCSRVIATHRRASRRRRRLWGRLASVPAERGRDPADVHAERTDITRAFARLSAEQREVLRLIAWDGLSTAEAAAVLDCTPGAFRVRYHRARYELEKHLAADGHEQVPARTAANAQAG
jgi:RNA polymerase sigma-70 factor, ECF subfamily